MKTFYVGITCEKYIPTRVKAQKDTFLKNADYVFISSKEHPGENIVGWDTSDDYNSCPQKYVAFFKNMDVHGDWIVFIDDDTFVYRDRLESFLSTFDSTKKYYIGLAFKDDLKTACLSGGAGFAISRCLYEEVCAYVRNTIDIWVDPMYGDITIFSWIQKISDVTCISDSRFHWTAASSIEEQKTAFTFHYASPSHMYSYYTETKMDISILIPTMKSRRHLFQQVLQEIKKQAVECHQIRTEILWEEDNGELTLGQKRNVLVDKCSGKYHCFIDDDDILAPDYLKTFVPMITSGIDYDCASFVGAHYNRGRFNKLFHHSLEYPMWGETSERFIRTISPMNLIKTDIVRQIRYKDIRNTEDHEFSKRLTSSGLLKTEFKIDANKPIYHYIDGVKHDREQWRHEWVGNYVRLYKPMPVYAYQQQSGGNVVYPFLKIYQR